MKHTEHIDRALAQLDYALIAFDPVPHLAAARKELLNLKIDLEINVSVDEFRRAVEAGEYTTDLPPLEGTNGPPERYAKKEVKPKYEKLEGRSLTFSQSSAAKKPTAKSVKCPTCGAPPWHYCAKVSTRGPGTQPLGSKQANDHDERRAKAREASEKRQQTDAS